MINNDELYKEINNYIKKIKQRLILRNLELLIIRELLYVLKK